MKTSAWNGAYSVIQCQRLRRVPALELENGEHHNEFRSIVDSIVLSPFDHDVKQMPIGNLALDGLYK